ncbi:MAG: class I SAM-dependent methyltransferase [Actinomycetota bacterium]
MEDAVVGPPEDWYNGLAAHLSSAYLRYGFTMGTSQEVDFLLPLLRLAPGKRLLDVGCGPGRHAIEFARRGVEVVGVDLSPDFLSIARTDAAEADVSISFFEMDARELAFEEEFDAVISLCEGAFGLGFDDLVILEGMRRALRPDGRLAAAAVNVFYVLEHMKSSGRFDPERMLYQETVDDVIGGDGTKRPFTMWNSCYTPRELQWLANGARLEPEVVYGVSPGDYAQVQPGFEHPELLLIARRPSV